MKTKVIMSVLICLLCVSCARKIKIPTKEEVDMQARVYETKGQDMDKNFTKKEKEKLEKYIADAEKVRIQGIKLEQEYVKKKMPVPQEERDKLYAKEYKLKEKVIKYHIQLCYDHQTPEVKKRLKKARRDADRRARKQKRSQR